MTRARCVLALLVSGALLSGVFGAPARAQSSYTLFESGPVRPVVLSPDGGRLFVTNIPDATLEIFDVGPGGLLMPAGSVPVGLEPVAVAARNDDEVWVVNHLSDSVSIVDVASQPPRVERTLLVGDEPRDIVFAGSPLRAFVTTAHRGQHRTHASLAGVIGAGDAQLTTEGIGRADVWVFDAAAPGSALGGLPLRILSFFADTPRALATDGTTVWVAAFQSGNQTMTIHEKSVPDTFASACGFGGQGIGIPGPPDNAAGVSAPDVGVMVKFDGTSWVDAQGCTWNAEVLFSLPDHDVFAVNANSLAAGPVFDHVGTILFNVAVNPVTGKVYVTNTELPNHVRFEGAGDHGGTTMQGRVSESRISVLDGAGPSVDPQHLNQHIDYGMLHTDAAANHAAIEAQKAHSLATPLQVVVSDELPEQRVFVAAFGSAKVGVFDASDLEDPLFETNFDPTAASVDYIDTPGGPAGLALSAGADRLYVFTRFDHAVSVYDVAGGANALLQSVQLPDAEPASAVEGRPFLYDADFGSGNGEASCASCHVFADVDHLAWDLGDPDGVVTSNPMIILQPGNLTNFDFHPMKGPMVTQTLRGISTHGPLHWRGDRSHGVVNPSPSPCTSATSGDCDAEVSSDNFVVAFEGLQGTHGLVATADMQSLTDFMLQLMLPPNPIANLDGSLTAEQFAGATVYFTIDVDSTGQCNTCHTIDPAQGFYGANGMAAFGGLPQIVKTPHLRNLYTRVGMFGRTGQTAFLGDQVRGFGFIHDGSMDTLFNFLEFRPFIPDTPESIQMEAFMLAFPSDLAPIVGQQVSIGDGSPSSFASTDVNDRITLLDTRAGTPFVSLVLGGSVTECDLIARTVEAGQARRYLRQAGGTFLPDDGGPAISEAGLRAKADPTGDAQDVDYLCVPPGNGARMALDRDEDSVHNGLDNCPAWPNGAALGTCTAGEPALLAASCSGAGDCGLGGFCSLAQEDGDLDGEGDACEISLLPEPGPGGLLAGTLWLWVLHRARRRGAAPL